jgi:cytochrome c553
MKWAFAIGAVGVVTAVAVLAAIFVPDLLAANRFEQALDRHTADYRADGGPWLQIQASCALCHGARGQSGNARYASLAGLSAAYVEAQLHAFADGRRYSIQMGPIAAGLNGAQI